MKRGPYKARQHLYQRALELRQAHNYGINRIAKELGVNLSSVRLWLADVPYDVHAVKIAGLRYKEKSPQQCRSKDARRRALIRLHGSNCEVCGLTVWQGKKLPIEVHHIDGNNRNNIEENLQLLCPNCHSLTDSWKRKTAP